MEYRMTRKSTFWNQVVAIASLALPMSLAFIIQISLSLVDAHFAGYISYRHLAAVSLGNAVYFIPFIFCLGVVISAGVLTAQAEGESSGNKQLIYTKAGLLLSACVGILFAIPLLFAEPILIFFQQPAFLASHAQSYLYWMGLSLPFQLATITIRDYLSIKDQPWVAVMPLAFIFLLNIGLDYVFIKGYFGENLAGINGIGFATLLCSILLYTLIFLSSKKYLQISWGNFFTGIDRQLINQLLVIGIPIGCTMLMQGTFHTAIAMLMGTMGSEFITANYILMNVYDLSYTTVFGIALAVSILAGISFGRNDMHSVKQLLYAGSVLGLIICIPFVLILLVYYEDWIGMFIDLSVAENLNVFNIVITSTVLVAFIIFLDTVIIVTVETLRGISDTMFSAVATFFIYWCLGLPIALYLLNYSTTPFNYIYTSILAMSALMFFALFVHLRRMHRV